MSLLNQKNNKDKKKEEKKKNAAGSQGSKFIQKPKSSGFVSKQSNTGSQRGSWSLSYMTKEELLRELSQETWVTLQPSPVHGIGVFAIRDIPRGCRTVFSANVGEWIKVPIADVERLPDHSRSMVETYCLYDEEHYYMPDYGFKVMDMVNYLNHSSTPNIMSVKDGEYFETIVDIPAGAELLVNYEAIVKVDGYDWADAVIFLKTFPPAIFPLLLPSGFDLLECDDRLS